MNFTRPLDLSVKTVYSDETRGTQVPPAWCDSLLNVKAIVSNHELLMDWNNEDTTGPWRWRCDRSPLFLSLKRKVSDFVNDEGGDIRTIQDGERSAPSDGADFFVFHCDIVPEDPVLQIESPGSRHTNSSPPSAKRDLMNELNMIWSGESYLSLGENYCWRFNSDSAAGSELEPLEMLLEELNLKYCLREVDPDLESITRCIEVSCPDELDGVGDLNPGVCDPDTEMFAKIEQADMEDCFTYENLVENLSMSDDDDDERDSGINETNSDPLKEEDSSSALKLLREKGFKDYSQVKAIPKNRSTANAVIPKLSLERESYNKEEVNEVSDTVRDTKKLVCESKNKGPDSTENNLSVSLSIKSSSQSLHENVDEVTGIPRHDREKCDEATSVSGTDIPDLSDILNRDSGLGYTPSDEPECFAGSDHDDLLIVCD